MKLLPNLSRIKCKALSYRHINFRKKEGEYIIDKIPKIDINKEQECVYM